VAVRPALSAGRQRDQGMPLENHTVGDSSVALLAGLEQAIDAVVMIDGANSVTHFNAAAERLWGYDRSEVIGRNVSFLVPMAIRRHHDGYIAANRSTSVNRIVGTSRPVKIERKDGTELWGSLSMSRVIVDGEITYMGFVRDVTAEVARAERVEMLSLVTDKTNRAVFITDHAMRISYINDAFTNMFGYSQAEAAGVLPGELLYGEYTDRGVLERMNHLIETEGSAEEELLFYDRNGQEIWISAVVNAIYDENRNLKYLAALLTDITEGKQLHSLQNQILETLANELPIGDVIDQLCRKVEIIAPDAICTVLHVDADGILHPLGAPSLPPHYCRSLDGIAIGPDVGCCGAAAFRGEPVLTTDISTDPLWDSFRSGALAAGLRSCWATPITSKDGRVIGTFAFYFRECRGPSRWHRKIVDTCVHLGALALEREEARREISRLAYFDTLTGLPNRAHMQQLMDGVIAASPAGESVALMFFDLDNFKDVNDTLGHAVGDELLVNVTRRLRSRLRPGDMLSRQGGDEFIALLPNCDADAAAVIANRILEAFGEPVALAGSLVPVSASIGISIYPQNASNIEDLLKTSDAAMYRAKYAGGATYRFFSAHLNRLSEERLAMGVALREAIHVGALRLHYQPQVRTIGGGLYGVEALARWTDPVFGEISPSTFIPLAEECGLIEQIGVWSLREACRQMAAWRDSGLDVPCVSVNLSPVSFQKGDLVTSLEETLAEHGLPPEALTLEVTESIAGSDPASAIATMNRIHDFGVGLAMDDFGTGYSSLSRLAHLPVRELKIDRSFVRDLETDKSVKAIATAMLRVGQSLGMTVVAEGVENEGQLRILAELGCDVIQGFLYSRALSVADFEVWLAQHQLSLAVAKLQGIGELAADRRPLGLAAAGNSKR
jgi:diguanylate cyclase (GGDEF)-like protein/PAS domain S-box-containing protein